EWTEERRAVIQVLADAGYRDERSKEPMILEGEKILLDLLAENPRNAEAWNVYLTNFWRFSFAAMGKVFGPSVMAAPQIAAIEKAAQNCPGDSTIKLWMEVRHGNSVAGAKLIPEIDRLGYARVDLPGAQQ